jgi:hypothetical protein
VNWEQLKTILWLRWRLTRNQWTRSGGLGAVLTVIVAIGAVGLGGASFVGALFGGALGLGAAKPLVLLGIWAGLTVVFLFLWTIGLLAELQRSETIDLQRLMHLPVALGQLFVVNYAASHLTLSIVVVVPAMTGLALGLTYSRGPLMLLLLPLAGSMVFMITAWTYCLRGWLATMMTNPRRRRTIIMGITLVFILTAQLPNLYFNVLQRADRRNHATATNTEEARQQHEARHTAETAKLNQLLALQKFIPPLWLPLGAWTLAEGRFLPALLGTLGGAGLGVLGLRRAYRSTVRFYQGVTGGSAAAPAVAASAPATEPAPPTGRCLVERRLPFVPEAASAVALATFRSMLRAPEVKMAWGTSFVVTLIMAASFLFRSRPQIPEVAKPFLATGAVTFSLFMLVQFFANQFGFDRDGFRTLMLSPAERRWILLGKNLACLPPGLGFGVFLLTLIAVWLHLSVLTFLSALLQLATLLALAGIAGNLLSILVPYRVQAGSMKPTKMPALATLVMVLCQMLFPLAMTPVFLPPVCAWLWQAAGWPAGVPVNFLVSAGLAVVGAIVYWQTLEPLGQLLQRRETRILNTITAEVE